MAESTAVRTKRDLVITHSDSGAAESYTVAYEPGDFTLDVPGQAVSLFLDRGVINDAGGRPSLRYGDQQPMTFSYSAYLRDVGDTAGTGGYATLFDLASPFDSGVVETDWTSTLSGYSDVFTLDTAILVDGTFVGEADKTLTLPYCSIRASLGDGDPSTVSVTGTSHALRPTLS